MPSDLQQIINSPDTVRIASILARTVPPAVGYPACDLLGKWAATRRQSSITRAVRLNQWMARGFRLERDELDRAVRQTLQNNIRDLYDLYHSLDRPDVVWRRVGLNALAEELVKRPEFSSRGLVIAGVHLSGFDSVVMSAVRQGGKGLVLTIPDPQGGRRVEYEIRKRTGMNILPASLDALRQAVQHLKKGGLVLTAIDRPIPDPRLRPRFFGQPAPLPTHHVFLAVKAHVPVVLMAVIRQKDGTYRVFGSELMEMEQAADHELGMLYNAERVLAQAEKFICLAPQQWNMPLPVWPELMDSVPN